MVSSINTTDQNSEVRLGCGRRLYTKTAISTGRVDRQEHKQTLDNNSILETRGAIGNLDDFIPLGGGTDAGSRSAAECIAKIKRIWAWGPASTLELARAVAAAKNPARHGQWQEIWKALPFSRRKADILAAIGARLRWVNWQTFANLPLGWSTLYELSKLPRAIFEEFVRNGGIHPGLKLREAKELVARFSGKRSESRTQNANVRERLRRFADFVRDTMSGWELEEREFATDTLTQLIEQIAVAERAVLTRDANSSSVITQLGLLTDPRIKL